MSTSTPLVSSSSASASSAASSPASSSASSSASASPSSSSATTSTAFVTSSTYKPLVFELTQLYDNPSGWGPNLNQPSLQGVPFAPFSKNDRLGRISDWSRPTFQQNRTRRGGITSSNLIADWGATNQPLFEYKHEEDDSSFSMVAERPKQRKMQSSMVRRPYQKRVYPQQNRNQQNQYQSSRGGWQGRGRGGYRGRGRGNYMNNRWNQAQDDAASKQFSIEPQNDWKEIEEIELSDITRTRVNVDVPSVCAECGVLDPYDVSFDRVSPKAPKTLSTVDKQVVTATTSEDPVIQRLQKQHVGTVYGTDAIISLLMGCSWSKYSWDLVITKTDDGIVFDKRSLSRIDLVTVNENSNKTEQLFQNESTDVDYPDNLAEEATRINCDFSQQVLSKGEQIKFSEANPFTHMFKNPIASVAYRYHKFKLSDKITLVCRCEVNAFIARQKQTCYLMIRALNEFDSSVDWRQKLDSQPSAMLSTEVSANAAKLAKWAAQAYLSNVNEIRLGFVSRTVSNDNLHHSILASQRYTPKEFASSTQVNPMAMWGTLRTLIEKIQKLENGKYLLMKDPSKTSLHLYNVTKSALFSSGSSASSSSSSSSSSSTSALSSSSTSSSFSGSSSSA
eukprot:TRINITY_DN2948_c1_g1_i1.p1 TRINITY_DN2948_c1_g1~~TRINITY_DN2948_c1_g1_i1.p1  ORF type:complete len:647 (+),score=226.68 TRINITY_DN2948_c1_g1_i1:85-1941(+)